MLFFKSFILENWPEARHYLLLVCKQLYCCLVHEFKPFNEIIQCRVLLLFSHRFPETKAIRVQVLSILVNFCAYHQGFIELIKSCLVCLRAQIFFWLLNFFDEFFYVFNTSVENLRKVLSLIEIPLELLRFLHKAAWVSCCQLSLPGHLIVAE